MKRVRAVLVAAILSLAALLPHAAPVGATNNVCSSAPNDQQWRANYHTSPNFGVQANIDPWNLLRCTGAYDDLLNGAFLWVGLEPVAAGDGQVVQVGITRCEDPTKPTTNACGNGHTGVLSWFYAYGGCPDAQGHIRFNSFWMANADGEINHTYQVRINAGDITFTGVSQVRTVSRSDPSIACWAAPGLGTSFQAFYAGEVWDDGDSLGTSSISPTVFSVLKYQNALGGSWFSYQVPTSGGCNANVGDYPGSNIHRCTSQDRIAGDTMNLWSE